MFDSYPISTAHATTKSAAQKDGAECEVILDQDGDLRLKVKYSNTHEVKTYLVNKGSLCLSSKVFRAMLGRHSRFLEGGHARQQLASPTSLHMIELEEDNNFAFETVLAIIHLQGDSVKTSVSFDELDNLAIICDKYDLLRSLFVFPQLWSQHLAEQWEKQEPLEAWVRIASTFRLPDVYRKVTRHLILNATSHPNGGLKGLVSSSDGDAVEDYIPASIHGMLLFAPF